MADSWKRFSLLVALVASMTHCLTHDVIQEVVLKLPHSGSTWFDAMLSHHPQIHHIRQYINPGQILDKPVNVAVKDKLENMSKMANAAVHVVGFSICPFKENHDFTRLMDNTSSIILAGGGAVHVPNVKYIFLERTNIVKMALATAAYHSETPRWNGDRQGRPLNAESLAHKVLAIRQGYSTLRNLVQPLSENFTSDGVLLHVLYENLQLNIVSELNRIALFLKVSADGFAWSFNVSGSTKSHGESLLDTIPNFEQVLKYFRERMAPCYVDMLTSVEIRVFESCP